MSESASFAAITAVMTDYFDGLYLGDTGRLKRVFHPGAQYVCASDGSLTRLSMDAYFGVVEARPSPASRSEPRADRILSIGFAGPVTAFVRAECAIGPKRFTDFLSFIRLDDEWRIIAKVFHFDLVEES